MKYKTHIKLVLELWYMFSVQCEELRKNHLTPHLVVTMPYACWFLWRIILYRGLQMMPLFSIWGCVLKGQIALEGDRRLQY